MVRDNNAGGTRIDRYVTHMQNVHQGTEGSQLKTGHDVGPPVIRKDWQSSRGALRQNKYVKGMASELQ